MEKELLVLLSGARSPSFTLFIFYSSVSPKFLATFTRNWVFSQRIPRVFPRSSPCPYLNFGLYREACFP
jgi:hypothetical protein